MELELINRISDFVVPVYCILAVAVIVLFNKQKALIAATANANPDRIYKFSKKNKNEVLTWQQQLVGTWDKVERRNFYDFMIFNGAPSFVANMKKDADSGQIIEFQDNGKIGRVTATGMPAGVSPWTEIGTNKEQAAPFAKEGKDAQNRPYMQSCWYDAETKIYNSFFAFTNGNTLLQQRNPTPEGMLYLRVEMTKPDGSSVWFDSKFKKVK